MAYYMYDEPRPPMPPTSAPSPTTPATSPASAPPPPPAPAAPAPAAPTGGPGTAEQYETARMKSGTFGDDHADAGNFNTGDPYLDAIRGGAHAGSEDYRRFSNAQMKAWQPAYDKTCPPDRPFRSEKSSPGGDVRNGAPSTLGNPDKSDCVAKPDESFGGGGGVGGGGRGGKGGKGVGLDGKYGMGQASDQIWDAIMGRLQGGSRFTPEIMATLQGQIKSQGEGAIKRGTDEANADLQRRGLARSSLAAGATRDVRTGIEGSMLQSQSALARAKVDADFQDKTQAIQDGMNWLNSMRSYVASMNATQAQKDVAMANIQLGYQQLSHATNTMREQHAQELQLLGFRV